MLQKPRINLIDGTPVSNNYKTGTISPNFCIPSSAKVTLGENSLWHLGMAPTYFPKNHYVRP